jgi:hypothetical protein
MQTNRFQAFVEFLLDNAFDIATILIAAYLVIRNELEPFGPDKIVDLATWILAVLGLIAVSGLWDRTRRMRRIERFSRESRDAILRYLSGELRVSDFLQPGRQLSNRALESATTVYLSGVSLSGTTRQYTHILGRRLVAGAKIRFIIVDPLDSVLQDMVLRSWVDATPEYHRDRIKTVETLIDYISKTPGSKGKVELGYLPFHPAFGMIIIDPNQPHGTCTVEIYHHKSAEPNPVIEVKASKDPFWFDFFLHQFEILWSNCRIKSLPENP